MGASATRLWLSGLKTAEAMLNDDVHCLGDVKTNTKRFCSDALQHVIVGPGSSRYYRLYSSSSCVCSSTQCCTDRKARRCSALKLLSTCGKTISGNSLKATFDDDKDRVCSLNKFQEEEGGK